MEPTKSRRDYHPLLSQSADGAGAGAAVSRLLDETTRREERWGAVVRSLFAALTLARFVALGGLGHGGTLAPGAWLSLLSSLLLLGFSVWVVVRARRGPIGPWTLALSVTVDAVVCVLKLLPNALWPEADYTGILNQPDWAMILLVLVFSGFRLSQPVVWLSAALNGAGLAALVLVDHARLGQAVVYEPSDVLLGGLYAAAATVLALFVARRTRSLVVAAGQASLRSLRAQQVLSSLLHENHDVRSLLSATTLGADLLVRELAPAHPQRELAETLRSDLGAITDLMSALRERAFQGLAAAEGVLAADLDVAASAVLSLVARRYPAVTIVRDLPAGLGVRLVGGAILLERVLLNLLVNACEGDGIRGATRVWLRAEPGPDGITVRITDDGPGFPAEMLDDRAHAATSKRQGSGFGLFLVRSLVADSGGRLHLGARAGGGARVELVLPGAMDAISSAIQPSPAAGGFGSPPAPRR